MAQPAKPTEEAIDRFYADLGRRVRDARVKLNLTQGQLAAQLGLTRSSVANLEAGRQRIPIHVLAQAAILLRVDASDLFSESQLAPRENDFSYVIPLLEGAPESTMQFVMGALTSLRALPV